MKARISALFFTLALMILGGCASTIKDFIIKEDIEVTPATSDALYIYATAQLVFNDSGLSPELGLRMGPGRYVLEAENADYWFFRAPRFVELVTYSLEGYAVDGTRLEGGIMLAKDSSNPCTAAIYVDSDRPTLKSKIHILNNSLLKLRGKTWTLSTDED